jgi:hypothetical protein
MVKRPTLLHVGNLLSASTPLRVENPSMRQPERAIVHVEVPVLQEKTHSMNGQLMGDASKAKKKQIWLCLLPQKKSTVQTKDSPSHQTCDTCMEY